MLRFWIRLSATLFAGWLLASAGVGLWVLPDLLLNAPVPRRTEAFRAEARAGIQESGGVFTKAQIRGGEGRPLTLWHLRRPSPKGAVIFLHGFGDDIWGTLGRARSLPDWDAVGFTFRGRDEDPSIPCTLGAWGRQWLCWPWRTWSGKGRIPGALSSNALSKISNGRPGTTSGGLSALWRFSPALRRSLPSSRQGGPPGSTHPRFHRPCRPAV